MKVVSADGTKVYKVTLRPQWADILKKAGGFRKWKEAKIISLIGAKKYSLAQWYEDADTMSILARDGMAAGKKEITK